MSPLQSPVQEVINVGDEQPAAAETEPEDGFDTTADDRPLFDLSLLNDAAAEDNADMQQQRLFRSGRHQQQRRSSSASVATTIASDVGSVMAMPKEAFLKSFTYVKPSTSTTNNPQKEEDKKDKKKEEEKEDMDWGVDFGTPVVTTTRAFLKKTRLPISNIDEFGIFSLSRISPGDYVKIINGRSVANSDNNNSSGNAILQKMNAAYEQDGILSVTTKTVDKKRTDDILVHATIVKPKPGMTLEELGLKVWIWGFLCIKTIQRGSIAKQTALQETDQVVSINDILCDNLNADQVAEIVQRLPRDVTITVLRRKQRVTGAFG